MTRTKFRAALGCLLALALSAVAPADAATLTRTSAFAYDNSSGLLLKEIIEPDTSNLCLVTEYTYDNFGNKATATPRNCNGSTGEAAAPGGDPVFASRTTVNTYDSRGQFPTTGTNAQGQSETRGFNADYGTLANLTDPNGLTTNWQYDGFGRKTLETRADGTKTKWDYLYCTGINGGTANCPTIGGVAGAWVVVVTPLASDGITQNGPITKTYYDTLNREIRIEIQGFDGSGISTAIYKDIQYDNLGRPYKTSRPYYSGQTTYWITVTYDNLGRAIQETQADGTTTGTSYNGLTVTVTNANSQTRTITKNSQGQVVGVTDAQGKTLAYTYDPFGNLTQTTDALGNIVTLSYDLRGRKTQMKDPDLGTWTYTYDALGQRIRQVDAKGQTSTFAYDKLSRMTNRSEADLISNWYYDQYKDGSVCAKGIGRLCQSETSTGYARTVTYDSVGRSSTSATTIDVPTPYGASQTYDGNGRLQTQTYPSGLTVKYVYTPLGYLKEVRENSSNALYWQANNQDAEGHWLQQTYGNGIQTTQGYFATNGRINAIQAGVGNVVQNLSYQYDNLGNVTSRGDGNQILSETFTYDTLNRLQTATVNSSGAGMQTQTFGYDALGNITSKSDVGSYTYPASGSTSARPHAVTQIQLAAGGIINFAYDMNGNLLIKNQYDAGGNNVPAKSSNYNYTSFNMPYSLAQGSVSSAFYYGPEHQRIKQISSAQGTTIYLNPDNSGGLFYERDIRPDNSVEQRNFITAAGQAVAIVKYTSVGGTTTVTTRYLHRDNLGSITAITNESGSVLERLAYEPFGKRRFVNGSADPNNTIQPQNTDRGFTGHEELDEVGLIHMNGRIYDPYIARFGSADPVIQDVQHLQSLNRFSYLWNAPLNGTDPSGFEFEMPEIEVPAPPMYPDIPLNFQMPLGTSTPYSGYGYGYGSRPGVNQPPAAQIVTSKIGVVRPFKPLSGRGRAGRGTANSGFTESGGLLKQAAELGEGLIPVWGAGKSSLAAFGSGHWGLGLAFAGMAVGEALTLGEADLVDAGPKLAMNQALKEAVGRETVQAAKGEVTVYRVFGGDARAEGFSWTTKDPRTVSNFRDAAGLPSGGASGSTNTANFLIEGRANIADIINSRSALPLDGNKGGLPELIINPKNVNIVDFSVIKP